MVYQSDSLLFERAIKQFSPDVFSHPVWAHFARFDGARLRDMIQPLLQMEKQMLLAGDSLSACDLLFLCAAAHCHLGNGAAALESIEQIIKFGKRRRNVVVVMWGYWGAAAVCFQQREFYRAAAYLRSLQSILERSGDWLLFDLLDMLCQSLLRQANERPGTGLSWLLPTDPSLQVIFRAMLHWGETPRGVELVYSEDWRSRVQQDLRSRWQSSWRKWVQWVRDHGAAAIRLIRPSASFGLLPYYQALYPPRGEQFLRQDADAIPQVSPALAEPQGEPAPSDSITTTADPSVPLIIPITGMPGTVAQPPVKDRRLKETVSKAPALKAVIAKTSGDPAMAFYFLGAFRLFLNDQIVSDYPSQKSLSILKYLAANRGKPTAKDILKEQFWADAEAEYARRNLHQAIYALRQALKHSGSDFPYILFENDCYLLNPDLEIWLDFEAFESHFRAAQRLEEAGSLPEAVAEYSIAEELYQGDFLEDDLYEDWPNAQRVYLRALYLDGLNHLSEYYISQKQYAPAILLCQKALARDNCSEQAYRCLIRCYLAQGQRQLAMRQYQTCVQTLKKELNLAPSNETRDLYHEIVNAK